LKFLPRSWDPANDVVGKDETDAGPAVLEVRCVLISTFDRNDDVVSVASAEPPVSEQFVDLFSELAIFEIRVPDAGGVLRRRDILSALGTDHRAVGISSRGSNDWRWCDAELTET
jgi:hypothetical protein